MRTLDNLKERSLVGPLKAIPAIAIMFCLGIPVAMAGATNRGENTSATPGEKSSTTTTPVDPHAREDNIRKGTTNTDNPNAGTGTDCPPISASSDEAARIARAQCLERGTSGSSGTDTTGTGTSGTGTSGTDTTGTGTSGTGTQ